MIYIDHDHLHMVGNVETGGEPWPGQVVVASGALRTAHERFRRQRIDNRCRRLLFLSCHWGVRLTSQGAPLELSGDPSAVARRIGRVRKSPWAIVFRWTLEPFLELNAARLLYGWV